MKNEVVKAGVKIEADELIKALNDLTQTLDQFAKKLNNLKRAKVSINSHDVKPSVDEIIKKIEKEFSNLLSENFAN